MEERKCEKVERRSVGGVAEGEEWRVVEGRRKKGRMERWGNSGVKNERKRGKWEKRKNANLTLNSKLQL